MDEPWQVFYEQFRMGVEEITELTVARDEELAELAHDAYEATTDLLIEEQGYGEDEALALSRAFADGVRKWLEEFDEDREWDALEVRLEIQQQESELTGDVPA